MHLNITTNRPLTEKEEKLLAIIEGALSPLSTIRSVALVSPADFKEVMYRPTVDSLRQAVRELMHVQWTQTERPGLYEPIILGFSGRSGVNALLVEFSNAYIQARAEALPGHRH